MKIKKAYLCQIIIDQYDDRSVNNIFITTSKSKATRWVKRAEKIIKNNEPRICNYFDNHNIEGVSPLFYDHFMYCQPIIPFLEEIEIR